MFAAARAGTADVEVAPGDDTTSTDDTEILVALGGVQ
jgi:hypothetical protein